MNNYKKFCYRIVSIILKNDFETNTKFQLKNMYRGLYEEHFISHMMKQEILIMVGKKYKLSKVKVVNSVLLEEMLRIQKEKLKEMKVIEEQLEKLKVYQEEQRLEVLK